MKGNLNRETRFKFTSLSGETSYVNEKPNNTILMTKAKECGYKLNFIAQKHNIGYRTFNRWLQY